MKKFIIIFCFLAFLAQGVVYSQDSVPTVKLEWPFDKPNGFENYAQELTFTNKGPMYLKEAINLYMQGYEIVKRYQIDDKAADPYKNNPYKVEALSPYNLGMRKDFVDSANFFERTMDIIRTYLIWDEDITAKPVYKSLYENTYKNIIYCCVYNGDIFRAYENIEEYKKTNPDDKFVLEWRARILGAITQRMEKYSWVYTGSMSVEEWRLKFKSAVEEALEKNYPAGSKKKEEIKKRIFPKYNVLTEVPVTEEKK